MGLFNLCQYLLYIYYMASLCVCNHRITGYSKPLSELEDPIGTTFTDIAELKGRIKLKGSFEEYELFSMVRNSKNEFYVAVMK